MLDLLSCFLSEVLSSTYLCKIMVLNARFNPTSFVSSSVVIIYHNNRFGQYGIDVFLREESHSGLGDNVLM